MGLIWAGNGIMTLNGTLFTFIKKKTMNRVTTPTYVILLNHHMMEKGVKYIFWVVTTCRDRLQNVFKSFEVTFYCPFRLWTEPSGSNFWAIEPLWTVAGHIKFKFACKRSAWCIFSRSSGLDAYWLAVASPVQAKEKALSF